ncbi:MAG: DHA2 family efflux MFS transporter permease subunit [Actinomycetota bacterium]|nr:DHA2 family efflux MFS transporter permease subunit [Actinomycetota bacterium]
MDEAAIHARRWWTLGVMCLSLMVIGVDNTILNVALPTLVRDLHATTSQLQWIVDAYTLVFAGLLLSAGSLGDRFGRRRGLTVGLVVFGVGSVASALVGSPNHLIATRALMGIGGALIMPATLSIISNVFTVPAERARAIAVWAGFSAMGIALGPLAGGWLLQHFWWGSVFMVNIPIVTLAVVGGRLFVPESKDPSPRGLDLVGALLSIVGLVVLVWGIIEAPGRGWTQPATLGSFLLAAVLLGSFVAWEMHSDHPMLDVQFFANPRFTAASMAITLVFFALFGSMFLQTQYLQFVLGYTALQAGLRVGPVAIVLMIAAPLSARLVERVGTKVVVASGLAIVSASLVVLSLATATSGYGPVLASMLIMGIGMGMTMAPATESIMGSLPRAKAGVGSAVNDTTRQIGGALGVAILGSLLASTYRSSLGTTASAAARASVGGALEVARGIGGAQGAALARAAKAAYVDGMSVGVLVAAGVALLGAFIALVFLPSRAKEEAIAPAEEEAIEDAGLEVATA